jgi:PTS system cellobiose-specific IIC component
VGEFIQNTILPAFMKFVNTRGVRAIKDGMMFSMPAIMVGAVFLLLFQLPIDAAQEFVANLGVVPYLSHGYTSTFQVTALITAIGIGYTWAKNDGWEPLSAGIIAMCTFLILIPDYVGAVVDPVTGTITAADSAAAATAAAGDEMLASQVSGLNKTWLAGQGMVAAIIAGLLSGLIYSAILKKDITIKMPEGVPDGVAAAFTGLIPAAIIFTGAVIVYHICDVTAHVTPVELIYKWLQTPLSGLTDSLGGAIAHAFLVPLFWWFGVHGATVVGAVMSPITQANLLENSAMALAGETLTPQNAHIITESLVSATMTVTGSGMTLGLVIYMVFFAKSAQMKQVGKLGLGSGIFNINEPILFGTPIVMNPKMLIPFIFVPTVAYAFTYLLTSWGILPITYLTVPWTTPPILSGFLLGGPMLALWQVIEIAWSFFAYLPFAKSLDNDYVAQQEAAED